MQLQRRGRGKLSVIMLLLSLPGDEEWSGGKAEKEGEEGEDSLSHGNGGGGRGERGRPSATFSFSSFSREIVRGRTGGKGGGDKLRAICRKSPSLVRPSLAAHTSPYMSQLGPNYCERGEGQL